MHGALAAGFALAVGYWFFEAFIHIFVLDKFAYKQYVFHMDANELWMRTTFSAMILILFVALDRAMNRQRRTQARVRGERDMLEQITASLGAGMAVLSSDYTIQWINKELLALKGDIVGGKCYATIETQDAICEHCPVREVMEGNRQNARREREITLANGARCWMEIIATPVKDQHGSITAVLELFVPIDARKKAECALEDTARELHALSQQILEAQEKERSRVARELHDALGQQLVAVHLEAGWLKHKFASATGADFEPLMKQILSATEEMQRIGKGLRPPILESCGFPESLSGLVKDFNNTSETKAMLHMAMAADQALTQRCMINLYRIVQESLTNVSRHAQAQSVDISLEIQDQNIILMVRDNGRGMTRGADHPRSGFGILGMKERAHLCGGTLTVSSEPGAGVCVTVCLPMDKCAAHTPQPPQQGDTP